MIAIGFATEKEKERAEALAYQLGLTIDNKAWPRLCVTEDKLVLLMEGFSPLFADFSKKSWQRRHAAGKKQGLVRACKPSPGTRIIDATAGWGRDAALLASFGATVMMVERHPVMAALLEDAVARIENSSSISHCLSLMCMDAKAYLQQLLPHELPEVIYLDPMHPERQKSALVKKDMQALQQLLGADKDAQELLALARHRALQRVVVKWPQKIPPLAPPDVSFSGKTVRFDVYVTAN